MKEIRPEQIRQILVRGTNWVGDAVMSVPALRELRRVFPAARISLLVRPWVRDVYGAADFADEVLDYDKAGLHRGWKGLQRLTADLRRRRFDLAVLFQNAFEAAFLAWAARIPRRLGYARDGRSLLLTHACRIDRDVRRVHQAYYYLDLLARGGLLPRRLWEQPDYRLDSRLSLRSSDVDWARQALAANDVSPGSTIVGINPGASYGGAKRWFPERYARVADDLAQRRGAAILIFGAASELPVAEEVARQMRCRPVMFAGRTKLGQLMALLRSCDLLITNDSGPMHLAAALDVPQLAIFGSTSEIATGPLSSAAEVLKHKVDCNPCFLRECPIDFRCMKGVAVDQVLAAADVLLERRARHKT